MKKSNLSLLALAATVSVSVFFSACSKKDDDPSLPTIGGYNTADEVAANNLVAYWSFNSNYNESKQSLSATSSGLTLTASGIKGSAYKGATSGYAALASAGTDLPVLKSFSICFWMNTAQYSDQARAIFQLENTDNFWGNISINLEPYVVNNVPNSDTARFKIEFTDTAATWTNQFIETKIGASIGKWVHIVSMYDAGTSTYSLFVNGSKISLPSGSSARYDNDPTSGGSNLGNLAFGPTGRVVFGTWKQVIDATADSWMGNYEGALDEFRIYKAALSESDVSALYQLELAGR